jgi:hypothetical protein
MPTSVQLIVDSPQHAKIPFDVTVIVSGVPEGAKVTVTLAQTHGKSPLWGPESQSDTAGTTGNLVFTFKDVALEGPTHAVLLASVVDDKGTFYPPCAESIEVL